MCVKNKLLIPTMLSGIVLLGLMVILCGIALSMGFKTISLIGFFGALIVLALLRIIGWLNSTPR
jgi:hypothetical protein